METILDKIILEKIKSIEEQLQTQNEKPLTIQGAADYLEISKSYLYKLTAKKQIPHHKPNGKLIYFNKSELNEWVYQSKTKNVRPTTAGRRKR